MLLEQVVGEASSNNCITHRVLERHLEVGVWGCGVKLEEGELARRLEDAKGFPVDVSRYVVQATLEVCCLVNPKDTVQCSSFSNNVLQSIATKQQTQSILCLAFHPEHQG